MKPFLIFPLMITLFISLSTGRDSLTPTNPLLDNQTLVSAGGTFALGFFTPGNSGNRYVGIWFNTVPDRRIVWVANRESPIVRSTGLLSITTNGTMMITDQRSKTIVWSTGGTTSSLSTSNPAAQLLDTGNFVVKEDGNNNLGYSWQSFEHLCDTLLAGMKLRMEWATGRTVHLTAWKSNDDPSDGEYYLDIDTGTVDFYLRSSSGGKVIWRSDGNWDGMNLRSKGLNYNFVNSSQEASFWFQASDKPMIFVASPTGTIQLLVLSSDSQRWDIAWEEPTNQCSVVGHCGPNGICDIESSPVCSCLEGYVPKNASKWASADWTDGCVREMGLDCRNGTDGFVAVNGAKLPEYPTAFAALASNLDECRLLCLRDCSCSAYAMDGDYYGCVNWHTNFLSDTVKIQGFDQDLYVRVTSSYLASHAQPHRSKHKVVAISVSLLLGALILATASVVCVLRKRRTRRDVTNISIGKSNESTVDRDIPLFDFSTIEAATEYFSVANELGHGGFGTVYKGKLSNGQEIAVKRLAATSLQGTDEFKNEVKLMVKLQNVYLVRLLGCCIQGTNERMLIYEYMSNKSLDAFLFDKQKVALLDWGTRNKIIIGIARGLLYLHHDSLFRIIHRDLKASNILLDNDMNPKISDFGMAKLFGGDETDFNTRKIVGTYGYMSPEYAMEGIFSLKSDVFSFGVLMLEIISGKKNRGANSTSPYLNLVAEAWNLWIRGESFKLVDESMSTPFSEEEVLRCIKVGLLCVQENPKNRPLMSAVIVMLGADIASLPEPKMPGFAARIGPFELDKISNNEDSLASNELTITLECR